MCKSVMKKDTKSADKLKELDIAADQEEWNTVQNKFWWMK